MSSLSRALALHLVVIAALVLGAAEAALEPHDGVLVLRNGFVLQGRITPINDVFLVSMGASGEVRLPRAEVEFHCRDLNDAYLQQRDALISDEPNAHVQLAEWCLRHGLIARAADQILIAFSQDPTHPQLRSLEQRLLSLGKPETVASQSPAAAGPLVPTLPMKSKLSPQLLQQFSTIIQPILFNRCATHACHGNGGTTNFRLIRPGLGHAATSRMTQRNLQAMLSYMDQQHPEKSPVLVQGGAPHGGSAAAPFTDKQFHQLELLESWVRRAASGPQDTIVTNSGGPKRAREPAAPSGQVAPAGYSAPEQRSTATPATYSESQPTASPYPTTNPVDSPTSRDPFDPEIFNRRYHPEGR